MTICVDAFRYPGTPWNTEEERARLLAYFERRVTRNGDQCWGWRRKPNTMSGYRTATICGEGKRRNVQAHRLAYELFVGPIPVGLVLDHLCRNRACVNPRHVEPVASRINVLRGESSAAKYARRTECSKGHPLTPENLYVRPSVKASRECLICKRETSRLYYRELTRQRGAKPRPYRWISTPASPDRSPSDG